MYKLSDAREIVNQKILVNRMIADNLKLHINYSQNQIQFFQEQMKIDGKKILLNNSLEKILALQLNEFTAERQEQCLQIYNKLNDLDINENLIKLYKKLKDLERRMAILIDKIKTVENIIPNEKTVTNYHIKRNLLQ